MSDVGARNSDIPDPSIIEAPYADGQPMVDAMRTALAMALADQGKLAGSGVLEIEGMSGQRYRLFINNLIDRIEQPRYLEVGSWAGSTLCSAIAGNAVTALAIDNWSQFGGPAKDFLTNLATHKTAGAKVSFLEQDFRKVDFRHIGKFNVYLFDGPHSRHDQYDGVVLALPALDDQFVLIVDDWNWQDVRAGTTDAVAALGLRIDAWVEIRTTQDNSHPPFEYAHRHGHWHNGYMIAVLSKPPA